GRFQESPKSDDAVRLIGPGGFGPQGQGPRAAGDSFALGHAQGPPSSSIIGTILLPHLPGEPDYPDGSSGRGSLRPPVRPDDRSSGFRVSSRCRPDDPDDRVS